MITTSIDSVAFLNVRWYGIFIALAITVVVLWTMKEVRRGANLSYDTVFTAALVGISSGIVLSKLRHVIDNIVVAKLHPGLVLTGQVIDYTQHPELILVASGLTAYGVWEPISCVRGHPFSLVYIKPR